MNLYNFQNPFISHIKFRRLLNKADSFKKTYHIVLDISNSNITYKPGDSLAIIPQNDPKIVELTINAMKSDPDELIIDPKTKKSVRLFDFLLHKANLTKATYNFFSLFTKISINEAKNIISSHHIWDLIKLFPNHDVKTQDMCDHLLPILPRLYSCASSLNMYPNEIHLIITHVEYELSSILRNGVTTEFMCNLAQLHKTPIPIYIQHSHGFSLTKDVEKPIIMIAAGCGIAPFRAFMEERFLSNSIGKNWLFFGERKAANDFYFESFFKDLEEKTILRINTAFSRDQEDKIYVQDRLLENGSDIWQWLCLGAIIYICGNIKMAREVDEKMQEIFIEEGNLTKEESAHFLRQLIKEKRYLKDVY
ncbi:MAG: hypothetical protein WCT85_04830 [Parachlamydiales bacterium]|jgi:sulfite reductase (NADPH) flavoprotein alpha-component